MHFYRFLKNECNIPDFLKNLISLKIFRILKKFNSLYLIGKKINTVEFFKKYDMFDSFTIYLKKSVKNHIFPKNYDLISHI